MALPKLSFFRDDFRVSTWLLVGACLQSLLVVSLPRFVALLPAAIVLVSRAFQGMLMNHGFIHSPSYDRVLPGRTTAQIPHEDGSFPQTAADKQVVVFILATRSNHPMGKFAPGFMEAGNYFRRCWQDLSANREKRGYLGKSSTLVAMDEDTSNTMVWLTYWEDLEHLHAFAHGDVHSAGLDWWYAKKYPHIAIGHETYVVPKGNWETIYHNFRPFGLGQTKHLIRDNGPDEKEVGGGHFVSPLRGAKGSTWKSMTSRMGRVDAA